MKISPGKLIRFNRPVLMFESFVHATARQNIRADYPKGDTFRSLVFTVVSVIPYEKRATSKYDENDDCLRVFVAAQNKAFWFNVEVRLLDVYITEITP